jgi:hypothetical protein
MLRVCLQTSEWKILQYHSRNCILLIDRWHMLTQRWGTNKRLLIMTRHAKLRLPTNCIVCTTAKESGIPKECRKRGNKEIWVDSFSRSLVVYFRRLPSGNSSLVPPDRILGLTFLAWPKKSGVDRSCPRQRSFLPGFGFLAIMLQTKLWGSQSEKLGHFLPSRSLLNVFMKARAEIYCMAR